MGHFCVSVNAAAVLFPLGAHLEFSNQLCNSKLVYLENVGTSSVAGTIDQNIYFDWKVL